MMLRLTAFFFSFLFAPLVYAQGIDHSDFDAYLKQVITPEGQVNYRLALEKRPALDAYIKRLQAINFKALDQNPQPELLAFWLNIYHAALLSLVLDHYPLDSTQTIPSFWERQFLGLGGKKTGENEDPNEPVKRLSLSQIRVDELMSRFNDVKVHLSLPVAAKDGPLFPRDAYTGPRALGQLYKKTRLEVNRPEMVQIDIAAKTVKLSRLFEWYAADFIEKYNRPERRAKLRRSDTAVVNFLIRYIKDAEKIKFLKTGQFKIEYAPFDWRLNDTSSAPAE